ncbi:MAG: hypothetical protein QM692_17140 [Thermomicrobiales bacterium]
MFWRAVWRAAPGLVAGVLALILSTNLLPLPALNLPVRSLIVIAAVMAGIGATFIFDRVSARPYWQMALAVVVILMPVTALQASALRTPFVALARGSAGPLLWLTMACGLVLAALWVFAILQPGDPAENAALIFLLPVMSLTSTLGASADLDERAVLAMLGLSGLAAGGATFIAILGPIGWRPLIAGAATIAQIVMLWVLRHGPVTGPDAGWVAPVCIVVLMAWALVLLAVAPLGSLFARRFFQTVGEEAGMTAPASVPKRGARRRSDV